MAALEGLRNSDEGRRLGCLVWVVGWLGGGARVGRVRWLREKSAKRDETASSKK